MRKRVILFFFLFMLFGALLLAIQLVHFGSLTGFIYYGNDENANDENVNAGDINAENNPASEDSPFNMIKFGLAFLIIAGLLVFLLYKLNSKPAVNLRHGLR